jgi:hypothetical protein
MDNYKGEELPDCCFVGTATAIIETLRDDREEFKLTQREVENLKPHTLGRHLTQIEHKQDGRAVLIKEGKVQERVWWLSKNGDFKDRIEAKG